MKCKYCGGISPSQNLVVSRGNPLSRLMIIGEAPGAEEEEKGLPFVGKSGRLLDYLLEENGINPDFDVYMCNAVKCRPPKNRKPTKSELKLSLPWLFTQIDIIDPWLIVLTGSTAVKSVLGINDQITSIRGKWHKWRGRLVMPVFHPAYLLRNPSKEAGKPFQLTLDDLGKVRNRLDRLNKDNPFVSSPALNLKEFK